MGIEAENGRGARDAIENVLGQSCISRRSERRRRVPHRRHRRGLGRLEGGGRRRRERRRARRRARHRRRRRGQSHRQRVCSGHLEILAKGRIEGDIDAKSVRIETGGVFRGTSRMGARPRRRRRRGRHGAARSPRSRGDVPRRSPTTGPGATSSASARRAGEAAARRLRIVIASDASRPIRTFSLPRGLPRVVTIVVGTLAVATVVSPAGRGR